MIRIKQNILIFFFHIGDGNTKVLFIYLFLFFNIFIGV